VARNSPSGEGQSQTPGDEATSRRAPWEDSRSGAKPDTPCPARPESGPMAPVAGERCVACLLQWVA